MKFFASVIWFYTCINEISGEAEFLKSSQKNVFTVHATHTLCVKSYKLKEFLTAQDNEIVFMYILIYVAMKTVTSSLML